MTHSLSKIASIVAITILGCTAAQADEATVIELMRQSGCVAPTPPAFDAMLAQAIGGEDFAKMGALSGTLLENATVWREVGTGIVLHPRHCGSNAHLLGHQEAGSALLTIMRDNGCVLAGSEVDTLVAPTGVDGDDFGRIVESWTNEGIVTVDNAAQEMRLQDSDC